MPNDAAMRWKKPKPAFDIDDAVDDLIRAHLIRGDFQGDPYLTARCYLGRASAIARKDLLKKKALSARRADLEKTEKKVRAVAKRLQKVAEEAEILLATSVTMGNETLDPSMEFERRAAAVNIRRPILSLSRRRSLVGEIEALGTALRAHRSNIPQCTDDAFRPAFIEEMVYCWVRFTAKHPTQSDEEVKAFVGAAHTTLFVASPTDLGLPFFVEPWDGEEESKRAAEFRDNWDWQFEKTLERIDKRPSYDGAYRYEQGFVLPTVDVQPPLERRRLTTTQSEFDEETKRLIKEMLADGEGSRAAAQILWCEYHLAGWDLQKRYFDAYDFNPADAQKRIWS
jgi:hypothetical protein